MLPTLVLYRLSISILCVLGCVLTYDPGCGPQAAVPGGVPWLRPLPGLAYVPFASRLRPRRRYLVVPGGGTVACPRRRPFARPSARPPPSLSWLSLRLCGPKQVPCCVCICQVRRRRHWLCPQAAALVARFIFLVVILVPQTFLLHPALMDEWSYRCCTCLARTRDTVEQPKSPFASPSHCPKTPQGTSSIKI